jgi:hypothetical protein
MAKKNKYVADATQESEFEFLRNGTISTQLFPEVDYLIYVVAVGDGLTYLFPISVIPEDILESIHGLELVDAE